MEFKLLFYTVPGVMCYCIFRSTVHHQEKFVSKACFLLMISSLFVMNYFSYVHVESRLQFVLVKTMRIIYIASTMLAIIRMVTPKIPHWIITFISPFLFFFLVGLRIFYFNEINIESQIVLSNQVFSVGREMYNPHPLLRISCYVLLYRSGTYLLYYRQFFMKMNKDNIHYLQLSRWIISMVVPFFLSYYFWLNIILGLNGCFS